MPREASVENKRAVVCGPHVRVKFGLLLQDTLNWHRQRVKQRPSVAGTATFRAGRIPAAEDMFSPAYL